MTLQSILLPMFVQIGLTYFLGFWLARQRWGLILRKEVRWQDIAMRQRSWPGRAQQVSHAFQNQFEVPVVFLCPSRVGNHHQKGRPCFVILEWLFVAMRIAHAYVHTTSTYVPLRGHFFLASAVILFLMWGIFAVGILAGP